jgi:hypothetical protein
MEKETILKIGGIVIVAVMALSMLAVAFLYTDNDGSNNTDGINTNPITSTFEYDISFNTTAIQNLNSFRMVAKTTQLDKQAIDLAVGRIEGIAKVNSQFRKTDGAEWDYFAEISTKKNTDLGTIINAIYALEYFSSSEQVVMKYMTISVPKEKIELYNTELNITRDFNFESGTLPALVSIETLPGDMLSVSGKITLQGKTVLELALVESENQTAQPQQYTAEAQLPILSLGNTIMFEGITLATIDENSLKEQINSIDSEAQVFFIPDANSTRVVGQSTIGKENEIETILVDFSEIKFLQEANFDTNSVYVTELNSDVPVEPTSFSAQVNLGHNVGDEISLSLNIYVQREIAFIAQGIEN